MLATAHALGLLLLAFSASYLLPIGWAAAQGDSASLAVFGASGAGTLLVALVLWLPARRHRSDLQPRDGCLLAVAGWLCAASSAAVPLALTIPQLTPGQAFFEALSALTATGATTVVGLDALPASVNLWRCTLAWVGGMAVLLLAVALLPLLGVGGMQLFRAGAPGPLKEGRLLPRLAQTARSLWTLYAGLTIACLLALRVAGLSWLDATGHAMSAVSLGGVSTRDASVAAFDSPLVEIVLAAFMLLSVLNFATHHVALRRRSLAPYRADPEARAVLLLSAASVVMIALLLDAQDVAETLPQALRHAGFAVVSAATTTGFAGPDTGAWPIFASFWLLFLCTVSASAGSVGGGIKMVRAMVLVKQSGRELARLAHPRAINPLSIGGALIDNKVIFAVLGFMLFYGLTAGALTMAMLATGLDLQDALASVLACLNNTVPGVGMLAAPGAPLALDGLQLGLLGFAMLAGRLELLALYALLTPAFWRR